ncbi:hypothetical protein P2318_06570 [Myxococcaceae bacterium GXIMD 01537]
MRTVIAALVALNLVACAHSATPAPSPAAPTAQTSMEGMKLVSEADRLVSAGKNAEALTPYRQAWELGARGTMWTYNAACAAALAGEKAEALTWLERAADAGLSQTKHMANDPDLVSVRSEPGYARVAEKVAANEAKLNAAEDPALRDELMKMMEEDQEARMALGRSDFKDEAAKARMAAIDTRNTARMKEIIAAKGWPGTKLVGANGSLAAWLLVQHADLDVAFQKQCLPLIEKAVAQGEASAKNLAYLTDRVLVAENKPQRYGTQFHEVDGNLVPRPLEDEARVDERRASVGLGTLAEYAEQMKRLSQMNQGGPK